MNLKSSKDVLVCCAVLALSLMTFGGCTTLPKSLDAGRAVEAQPGPESGNIENLVLVEIRPAMGEPLRLSAPFEEGMTVQTVLDATKALKKVRVPDIVVARKIPGRYQPLLMTSGLKEGSKRVKFEEDYALHGGDRILIRPREVANPLEKFIGKK